MLSLPHGFRQALFAICSYCERSKETPGETLGKGKELEARLYAQCVATSTGGLAPLFLVQKGPKIEGVIRLPILVYIPVVLPPSLEG